MQGTFSIKVIPSAKKDRIVAAEGGYRVYLSAPAKEGKANKALIAFLAEAWEVSPSRITIIKGNLSRHKIVEVK